MKSVRKVLEAWANVRSGYYTAEDEAKRFTWTPCLLILLGAVVLLLVYFGKLKI